MTPFPETEIMTIKRLEVALRKMDFKLLKDGAYKLHEKYHSGFKFEYLDLLKELFVNISNNQSIPADIRDILTPTIEDILTRQGVKTDTTTSPYDSLNQDRVSSLTSLSYKTHKDYEAQAAPKINAFDAFSPKREETTAAVSDEFNQSSSISAPFKEFEVPQSMKNIISNSEAMQQNDISKEQTFENSSQDTTQIKQPEEVQNHFVFENVQTNTAQTNEVKQDTVNEISYDKDIDEPYMEEETVQVSQEPQSNALKSVALFYSQSSSTEKIKNILKYRELLKSASDEHISMMEILNLISEINTQSDTNVSELQSIVEYMSQKGNKLSIITNSQSAKITELFKNSKVEYDVFAKSNEGVNLIPVFGLTNLFKCSHCDEEYIDDNSSIRPLVLTCPKCKNPMFPDFYIGKGQNYALNMEYYNSSLIALANSKVWLLVHPLLDEKTTFDLLRSALKVSSQVEEIFILDKDINVRETYKNVFSKIKPDIKINIQMTALEDFLNLFK